MIHTEEVHCPYCQSNDLQKNGKSSNGLQRWHCKICGKYFQREYRYNACKQGTYEKIIELTLNSSGVRDIGRILKINKNTVVAVLYKFQYIFTNKRNIITFAKKILCLRYESR